jgi:hypothetical protein
MLILYYIAHPIPSIISPANVMFKTSEQAFLDLVEELLV